MTGFGSIAITDYERAIGRRRQRWWNRVALVSVAFTLGWLVPSPIDKNTFENWSYEQGLRHALSTKPNRQQLGIVTILGDIEDGVRTLGQVARQRDDNGMQAVATLGQTAITTVKMLQELDAGEGKHSGECKLWLERIRQVLGK